MNVLIISANREEINMRTWPLGAACVAAAVRETGSAVTLADMMGSKDPVAETTRVVRQVQPDLIGVSVRNIDDQKADSTQFFVDEVRSIVQACRESSNAPVVLGGAGYSMFPAVLLDYVNADMGIQGEGEAAFVELVERLENGTEPSGLPGLYLRGLGLQGPRQYEADLDRFPLPDPLLFSDIPPATDEFWFPVQTRRGCPMKCSYCSTATIEGCRFRSRSPEKVAAWVSKWAEIGFKQIHFVDNTFNLPPSYAEKLCLALTQAGLGLTWRCILYPKQVDDRLASLMAEAGCNEVSVGFESGSEPILRSMNKRFVPDEVRGTCDILHRHGIRSMGFLMLGGPGETRETALESLRFADSLDIDCFKITVGIRIYPYTSLAETAVEQGIISPDDNLLQPRFYLAPEIADWLTETAAQWTAERPHWMS